MEFVLVTGAVAITGVIIWIRRKRLTIALPCAFAFLLYASILIPNILPPRTVSAQPACVAYFKYIQNAKAEWAEKNHKLPSDVPRIEELFSTNNASPYQWIPKCPSGGEYNVGAVNQKSELYTFEQGAQVAMIGASGNVDETVVVRLPCSCRSS